MAAAPLREKNCLRFMSSFSAERLPNVFRVFANLVILAAPVNSIWPTILRWDGNRHSEFAALLFMTFLAVRFGKDMHAQLLKSSAPAFSTH
jgi:hypothetical protein